MCMRLCMRLCVCAVVCKCTPPPLTHDGAASTLPLSPVLLRRRPPSMLQPASLAKLRPDPVSASLEDMRQELERQKYEQDTTDELVLNEMIEAVARCVVLC